MMMDNNFINAVKNCDYKYLKEALSFEQTPNVIGSDGKSALLVATERHDISMIQWLLKHGADIDFYDPDYKIIDQTAFLYAGANGFNDILELLLPYKPDVSIRNGYGGNPLIPQEGKGQVSNVQFLFGKTEVYCKFIKHLTLK